jgi:hypothetical protein
VKVSRVSNVVYYHYTLLTVHAGNAVLSATSSHFNNCVYSHYALLTQTGDDPVYVVCSACAKSTFGYDVSSNSSKRLSTDKFNIASAPGISSAVPFACQVATLFSTNTEVVLK